MNEPSLPTTSPFQSTTSPGLSSAGTAVTTEPPAEIPLAWLGAVAGPGAARGQTFVLLPETVVGRATGHILLSGDRTVSAQHAKVRCELQQGQPVFVIYDLASANGIFVGRPDHLDDEANRVYRHELRSGDYILLGETILVFWQA